MSFWRTSFAGRAQNRYGPNRVGVGAARSSWSRELAIKMFFKEDRIPILGSRHLYPRR